MNTHIYLLGNASQLTRGAFLGNILEFGRPGYQIYVPPPPPPKE